VIWGRFPRAGPGNENPLPLISAQHRRYALPFHLLSALTSKSSFQSSEGLHSLWQGNPTQGKNNVLLDIKLRTGWWS